MSPDVVASVVNHVTEERLEEYAFERVCEPELSLLEEHLLFCEVCQAQLAAIDRYRALITAGLNDFATQSAAPAPVLPSLPGTDALEDARRHSRFRQVRRLGYSDCPG